MLRSTMEIVNRTIDLAKENARLTAQVYKLEQDLIGETDIRKRLHMLDIEEAKNALRKEMQQKLIESDLLRVEALAKLETYEKMDTKDDRKHMRSMLQEAIKGLSVKPMVVK